MRPRSVVQRATSRQSYLDFFWLGRFSADYETVGGFVGPRQDAEMSSRIRRRKSAGDRVHLTATS